MMSVLPEPIRHGFHPPAMSTVEFRQLRDLVYRSAGIHLNESKRALMIARLSRRLQELGLSSFADYYEVVSRDESGELTTMLDQICTNETHFFREPEHFRLLRELVAPELRKEAEARARPRRVQVWSAGCSTGQEPYSLAMTLLDCLPLSEGWEHQVMATDLSTKVLAAARAGVFSIGKVEEIPLEYRKRFMLRGVAEQAAKMKAGPEIRGVVRFARLNLNEDLPSSFGPFDVIFCRNVLIYFDAESRRRVIERLLSRLRPGGYLFFGHAEALNALPKGMRSVGPNAYALQPEGRGRA